MGYVNFIIVHGLILLEPHLLVGDGQISCLEESSVLTGYFVSYGCAGKKFNNMKWDINVPIGCIGGLLMSH